MRENQMQIGSSSQFEKQQLFSDFEVNSRHSIILFINTDVSFCVSKRQGFPISA